MSTATGTETIEHLDVNEARRCEHSEHDRYRDRHAEGDELFVLITTHCPCESGPTAIVFCRRWIEYAHWVHCPDCGHSEHASEVYTILGPANSAA